MQVFESIRYLILEATEQIRIMLSLFDLIPCGAVHFDIKLIILWIPTFGTVTLALVLGFFISSLLVIDGYYYCRVARRSSWNWKRQIWVTVDYGVFWSGCEDKVLYCICSEPFTRQPIHSMGPFRSLDRLLGSGPANHVTPQMIWHHLFFITTWFLHGLNFRLSNWIM